MNKSPPRGHRRNAVESDAPPSLPSILQLTDQPTRRRGAQRKRAGHNRGSDCSFRQDAEKAHRSPDPDTRRYGSVLEVLHKARQDVAEEERPVDELYDTRGLVLQDNAAFITDMGRTHELPASRIPGEYHLCDDATLARLATLSLEDREYQRRVEAQEATIFPSNRPSGRNEVILLAKLLDRMLGQCKLLSGEAASREWIRQATSQLQIASELKGAEGDTEADVVLKQFDALQAVGASAACWEGVELFQQEFAVWEVVLSEIVRQVHVHCAERGILLDRVRCRMASLFEMGISVYHSLSKIVVQMLEYVKAAVARLEASPQSQEKQDIAEQDWLETCSNDSDNLIQGEELSLKEFGFEMKPHIDVPSAFRSDGVAKRTTLSDVLASGGVEAAMETMIVQTSRSTFTQTPKVYVCLSKRAAQVCTQCDSEMNVQSYCWSCVVRFQQAEKDMKTRLDHSIQKQNLMRDEILESHKQKEEVALKLLHSEAEVVRLRAELEEALRPPDPVAVLVHAPPTPKPKVVEEVQERSWQDRDIQADAVYKGPDVASGLRLKKQLGILQQENSDLRNELDKMQKELHRALNDQLPIPGPDEPCPLCKRLKSVDKVKGIHKSTQAGAQQAEEGTSTEPLTWESCNEWLGVTHALCQTQTDAAKPPSPNSLGARRIELLQKHDQALDSAVHMAAKFDAEQRLKQTDSNQDGMVDLEEFLEHGGTKDDFQALDVNGDGVISESELCKQSVKILREADSQADLVHGAQMRVSTAEADYQAFIQKAEANKARLARAEAVMEGGGLEKDQAALLAVQEVLVEAAAVCGLLEAAGLDSNVVQQLEQVLAGGEASPEVVEQAVARAAELTHELQDKGQGEVAAEVAKLELKLQKLDMTATKKSEYQEAKEAVADDEIIAHQKQEALGVAQEMLTRFELVQTLSWAPDDIGMLLSADPSTLDDDSRKNLDVLAQQRLVLEQRVARLEEELRVAKSEQCPDVGAHAKIDKAPAPSRVPSRIERNAAATTIQRNFKASQDRRAGGPRYQFKDQPKPLEWILERASTLYYKHIEQHSDTSNSLSATVTPMALFTLEHLWASTKDPEGDLAELLSAVAAHIDRDPAATLFSRFLLEEAPRNSLCFFLKMLGKVDSALGSKFKDRVRSVQPGQCDLIWHSLLPACSDERRRAGLDSLGASPDEGNLALALVDEYVCLEQALLARIVEEFNSFCSATGGTVSYGLFIKLASAVSGGSAVETHEAVRLWRIPLPSAHSMDGEWERARLNLGQVVVSLMHTTSTVRGHFRRWYTSKEPISLKSPTQCAATDPNSATVDELRSMWACFEPALGKHIVALNIDDATTLASLRDGLSNVLDLANGLDCGISVAGSMYHSLLDIVSTQAFALSCPPETAQSPVQWEQRQQVLKVIETSVRQLWAMGETADAKKATQALAHKVQSWKYVRVILPKLALVARPCL